MEELCKIMAHIYAYGPWRIEIYVDPEDKYGDDVNNITWEVWLWHKGCGIKDFMFGLPKYNSAGKEQYKDYNEVLEIVEANLPQYIGMYYEEFMKGE